MTVVYCFIVSCYVILCSMMSYFVVYYSLRHGALWFTVSWREMRSVTVVYCYIVLYDIIFCCILQPQTWRSVEMASWRMVRSVTVGTMGTARTPVVIPAASPALTAKPVP